jgi:hypothetical protein
MRFVRRLQAAGLALVIAGSLWGVWQILKARYSSGDVHPPYSSLRADRLGTRALHDALNRVPGMAARRLFEQPAPADLPRGTTVLVLGWRAADTAAAPVSFARHLEQLASAGHRVVIALVPEADQTWATRRLERRALRARSPGSDADEAVSLREAWGFHVAYHDLPEAEDGRIQPVTAERAGDGEMFAGMPKSVPWHSGVGLTELTNAWDTVYEVEGESVLIVRRWGAGTLVISTDGFQFSNEALRTDRHLAILGWLLGGNRNVCFQETHLGLQRSAGVAHLARRYRLHGFVMGLLLLAVLAVWRSASSLVPRQTSPPLTAPIGGLDSNLGLANLIRRSIPANDLPRVCFEEWHRTIGVGDTRWTPVTAALIGVVQEDAARPRHARDPVVAFNAMRKAHLERARIAALSRPALDQPRP